MKAPVIAGVAASAIVAGLMFAPVVQAAPDMWSAAASQGAPARVQPSGHALVRIENGSAMTVRKGAGLYRVVLPKRAAVSWMGEVGRELSIGKFSPKALVAAWGRLGHRDGTRSLTTLTYVKPGESSPTFVLGHIAKPRVSATGQLSFLAKVLSPLPQTMPNFTVNIARPAPAVQQFVRSADDSYPLSLPISMASNNVGIQATVTGNYTASIAWVTVKDGIATECPSLPVFGLDFYKEGRHSFSGMCGDVFWAPNGTYGPTAVYLYPPEMYDHGYIYLVESFQRSTNGAIFNWYFGIGAWCAGGQPPDATGFCPFFA
ncbi:MAG: hypothetical protein ACR2KE_00535 [Candidatus Nanopelagicales bacterium]